MKVLHIASSLRSGGAERQLIETVKFLKSKPKIDCEILVMSDDIHYDYVHNLDVKIHKAIRETNRDFSIFFKFYKLFKKIKPDIVHSWNSMCSIYAVPATKLLGIKFVNNFLRDAPNNLGLKNKVWLRAKLTFPFSDVVASNSYAGLKSYKVSKKKQACLHNGFDFSRIQNLDHKDFIRRQFNIQTPHVVGMVASFSEKKDYKTFVEAAHIILEKRNDVTFVAIGGGEHFDEIKNRIKPEYWEYFRMPGIQKRVLNIANIFDIGVLTTNVYTHGEGIPNVVMEYMALKKPAIVTDCGGNRELVEDEKTGFLVAPANPEQLAEKIGFLLDDEKLATELGKNGYQKLKKEFSLDVMGNAFLVLYNSILTAQH